MGELGEGAALSPESELVMEFKVSRASLREALRILEAESLIEVRRGSLRAESMSFTSEVNASKCNSLLLLLRGATL